MSPNEGFVTLTTGGFGACRQATPPSGEQGDQSDRDGCERHATAMVHLLSCAVEFTGLGERRTQTLCSPYEAIAPV